MKNKFYLKEFQFFDGEDTVVFNILSVDGDKITIAVTKCGKISVSDYDLYTDKNGLYFEYGVAGKEHIHIDDFEGVNNGKLRKIQQKLLRTMQAL